MTILDVQEELFKVVIEAYDRISDKFDFIANKYAIEIKVGDSIQDLSYRDDISLQIRIVGLETNKIDIEQKAIDIDLLINKADIGTFYIVRNNVYYSSYSDDDKFNVVLQYTIQNY
ncbi:hypothetical protein [Inconstantimicrobium mannanitabidum]|uniref:Uncharacterized protein n=1 Tax=Inconstantimicrobium mannanitabidum TaxID=1604901 RepID=A0ACB5R9H8_9CLOT|nr:hypothetical protein [Clostridium sp. TW13]GKX65835.1 hypothetical protein rsdtw13_10930 [Clostridium sp. TW13]